VSLPTGEGRSYLAGSWSDRQTLSEESIADCTQVEAWIQTLLEHGGNKYIVWFIMRVSTPSARRIVANLILM
jgi:hypothetical protein